jgi:hypothetical protein
VCVCACACACACAGAIARVCWGCVYTDRVERLAELGPLLDLGLEQNRLEVDREPVTEHGWGPRDKLQTNRPFVELATGNN